MLMRTIDDIWLVFTFWSGFFLLPSAVVPADEPGAATVSAQDPPETAAIRIDRDNLQGRRFRFSWKSKEGGAVNGIALLKEDGTIHGIGSPNETTWLVDDSGQLLFKHADGRISTRFDKLQQVEGSLCFEGPFLFRDGITHYLVEIDNQVSESEHRIAEDQAAAIKYSKQRFVYLDPGESCTFRLRNGTDKRIGLLSVKESKDLVIGLIRRAEVRVEIDGEALDLTCAPYVMPTETPGLRIQADTTSAWLAIPKRVQFSLWDAADPIVDTNLFCFPLPGYRLFSQGMQAYNEPVHLGHKDGDPAGQRFYHNYGVDLAGYEGRQRVLSCIEGVVVQLDHQEGDLSIRDNQGFILYYGHLDSILAEIRIGTPVKRGQWVAMLGRRGASGNFSHLHVGAFLSEAAMTGGQLNRNLNLYPWLVATYQEEYGPGPYAVAGPHQTTRTGDRVVFDGGTSLAPDSAITAFQWEFPDGTSVNGSRVEKVFEKPGCYMATLRVKDNRGRTDVDFCRVRVFSRSAPEDVIPTLFVTYIPSEEVRVNQPVNFRIWPQGMEVDDIQIDFGEGTLLRDYRPYSAITHKFSTPGLQVVTVTGRSGALPVTQKVKVVVEE
jgi:murein DD-endopeptidase MepM/ murein hydrolase activator NlpD